jgi:hypothetical protein
MSNFFVLGTTEFEMCAESICPIVQLVHHNKMVCRFKIILLTHKLEPTILPQCPLPSTFNRMLCALNCLAYNHYYSIATFSLPFGNLLLDMDMLFMLSIVKKVAK